MIANLTEQTLALLKKLQSENILAKDTTTTGITTGTGIVNYNLEPYAKTLYPVITPIRNRTPRFTDPNGGNAVNWKVITAINPGRTFPGVSEGIRGAQISQTEGNRMASFVRFSLENSLTEEAMMQAQGFDNALAIMADNLLRSMFIAEEEWMLAGNASGLQTPGAPTGNVGSGGNMTAHATKCFVAALTYDGYKRASVSGGVYTTLVQTSPMGESQTVNCGVSPVSPAGSATTSSGDQSVTWQVTAVAGAFAYAWFVDKTGTGLGTAQLAAITTTNVFAQTADATGTQVANGAGTGGGGNLGATDYSANATLAFDGLISQAINPRVSTATGYYQSLDNATLTGDNNGNVVEIDTALKYFYDTWKVSPTKMWVGSQQALNITQKVLAGGNAPVYSIRFAGDQGAGPAGIAGGSFVPVYNNKFAVGGPKAIPIEVHPNIPSGKIFFDCDEIPYPLANIPGPYRMHLLRDYWQRLWPQTTETRYTSVNFYGVLQLYVPFAMGVIDNIAAG
ncbi:MAG: hypothetical protein ABSD20_14000 [Terriglobales bacterium]|jgi:hypothetical protein